MIKNGIESKHEFFWREWGFAAACYLGIRVFFHVEGLTHHLFHVVQGGSPDQTQFLLAEGEGHFFVLAQTHVICLCQNGIELEFIDVALAAL